MIDTVDENEHVEKAKQSTERIAEMIDNFAELSKKGQIPTTTESVDIESVVEDCWGRLRTDAAAVHIEDSFTVEGDVDQLKSLFENLLQNAITHAGPDVTIRIGTLEGAEGFYVEDDGAGISTEHDSIEQYFVPGFSTEDEQEGFGLAFVKHISEAHGWTVALVESETGGARFEFRDVTLVKED